MNVITDRESGRSRGFAFITYDAPSDANKAMAEDLNVAFPLVFWARQEYSAKASVGEASTISAISLVLHPAISFAICHLLHVPRELTSAVVLMAAMAPGVNAYLFASMYHRGQSTAASAVLLGTAASILSVSAWLWILETA